MSTLREAAEKALEYMESRECHHESTHRGGVLWTICDDCGRKWADDEGGFVEYREPIPIAALRAALSAPAADGWVPVAERMPDAAKCRPADGLPRYLPEFKPSPPDAAKCQPAVPLTEEDVRRIVRDELAKGGA